MSHDTRTPMNAIIGITSLIRHDAGNKAKVIEYADKIDISSQHLLGIINDVLDMSKIEAGKTVLRFRSHRDRPAARLSEQLHPRPGGCNGIPSCDEGI
mgnify:CR=1 FL=1